MSDDRAEARRQQALVQALLQGAAVPGLRALPGVELARGLQAYRGHAKALSSQALAVVFVRLQAVLGAAEFAAMAWAFWRACPPSQGDLACWGQDLPEFLAAQQGMEPWLPDCARLEWAAHQAERAADAELDVGSLNALAEQAPETLRLRLRPGLSLLDLVPEAAALWPLDVAGAAPVTLLVWRRAWRAEARALPSDWCCFMRALLNDLSLQQVLDLTLAAYPGFDFSAWLQTALAEAWLQAAEPFPLESSS